MGDNDLESKIRERLRSLASGTVAPDESADWALEVMESDVPELCDARIWTALDRLSGADLMVGPGQYLHGTDDYAEWLAEFDADGSRWPGK
ncbi:DNA-binding protein [Streptomyces sp. NPDC049915]|uniref:DNA-binding protein n=1 Tax=Streptomyces sp. NPDC049915 TaxID=3155510 RepID=UPI003430F1A2